jgi:hypothetical protein
VRGRRARHWAYPVLASDTCQRTWPHPDGVGPFGCRPIESAPRCRNSLSGKVLSDAGNSMQPLWSSWACGVVPAFRIPSGSSSVPSLRVRRARGVLHGAGTSRRRVTGSVGNDSVPSGLRGFHVAFADLRSSSTQSWFDRPLRPTRRAGEAE